MTTISKTTKFSTWELGCSSAVKTAKTPAPSKVEKPSSCNVVEELDNKVIAKLKELNLESTTYSHELAYTVEEQAVHVGHLPGLLQLIISTNFHLNVYIMPFCAFLRLPYEESVFER
jgi:hypothetical protein